MFNFAKENRANSTTRTHFLVVRLLISGAAGAIEIQEIDSVKPPFPQK